MTITVYGTPGPQGSKRSIGGHRMVESSAKVKPWREAVKWAAMEATRGMDRPCLRGPVTMAVTFYLQKPKKPRSRFPDRYPDLSKLVRSTEDALTEAGIWEDDARVVSTTSAKRYAGDAGALPIPGAEISIFTASEQ